MAVLILAPQTHLHDCQKRRDRHRLDRTVLATLPLSHADLLEPHGGDRRLIRHPFRCHAVSLKRRRMDLAALAWCIPLIAVLKPSRSDWQASENP
jgi:hypothetical protein